MTTAVITPASFPPPHLALRTTDPVELARVGAFAQPQAAMAESVRADLARVWPHRTKRQRIELLHRAYRGLVQWRYGLAVTAPGRLGTGLPLDAERFRTPIAAGQPRIDRVGDLGRLRHGSTWDDDTRSYVGGESTPAYEIMLRYGSLAHERMDAAGADELLRDPVLLPRDGREVAGTTLARGEAGQRVIARLVARVASRGRDVSRMEVGRDVVCVVIAEPDVRAEMFSAALDVLADDDAVDHPLTAVQVARPLLVSSPKTYKGSDAVVRVFLVAVGSMLLGRRLVLEQDMDLRCLVLGQASSTSMPADTSPSTL